MTTRCEHRETYGDHDWRDRGEELECGECGETAERCSSCGTIADMGEHGEICAPCAVCDECGDECASPVPAGEWLVCDRCASDGEAEAKAAADHERRVEEGCPCCDLGTVAAADVSLGSLCADCQRVDTRSPDDDCEHNWRQADDGVTDCQYCGMRLSALVWEFGRL